MARPTRQATLNSRVEQAENDIRDKLPELTKVLLDAALNADLEVTCMFCHKKNAVKLKGDPRIAITLLERIAGKATEKPKDTSGTGNVERLIMALAEQPATTGSKTPAQQAAEAVALAETRAALRAAAVLA